MLERGVVEVLQEDAAQLSSSRTPPPATAVGRPPGPSWVSLGLVLRQVHAAAFPGGLESVRDEAQPRQARQVERVEAHEGHPVQLPWKKREDPVTHEARLGLVGGDLGLRRVGVLLRHRRNGDTWRRISSHTLRMRSPSSVGPAPCATPGVMMWKPENRSVDDGQDGHGHQHLQQGEASGAQFP